MKKKLESYIFSSFGFQVLLHDVPVRETDAGEEFMDINMKVLEEAVVRTLLVSQAALTGAKLKFFRGFLGCSLRDLGSEIDVPHTSLKLWEDQSDRRTGLEPSQEMRLRYLVLLHLQSVEQKEFSKILFGKSSTILAEDGRPLEIKAEYKYGA